MEPKSLDNSYIFISYAHKDKAIVTKYLDYLDEHHVCFWFDDKTKAGDEWDEVIAEHLINANYVLLFVSSNSNTNRNVNQEVIMALNHDIIVIPIFIEDVNLAPKLELKISSLHMVKLLNADQEENNCLLLGQIPEECIFSVNSERKATKLYVGNDAKELARLKLQSEIVQSFDKAVFDKWLNGKKDLCVLDFGCNDGTNSYLRFNKREEVSSVLGFEYYQEAIDSGKQKYGNSKLHFYQVDLEDDDAIDIVENALVENGREKADFILLSYIVLHLKNPGKVLRLARKVLADDGVIMAIDIDDGLRMYYPDPNGNFDRAVKIEAKTAAAGYRCCGRSIYSLAKNNGFTRIKLEKVGLTTMDMDYDQRDAFFSMCFSYMIPKLKKMLEEKPDNKEIRRDYEWYVSAYDNMHDQFVANDFFAFSPLMIFSLQK